MLTDGKPVVPVPNRSACGYVIFGTDRCSLVQKRCPITPKGRVNCFAGWSARKRASEQEASNAD